MGVEYLIKYSQHGAQVMNTSYFVSGTEITSARFLSKEESKSDIRCSIFIDVSIKGDMQEQCRGE